MAAMKWKGSQLATRSQSEWLGDRPLSIQPKYHRIGTSVAIAQRTATSFNTPPWSRNLREMDASTWMKVKKPMKPKK